MVVRCENCPIAPNETCVALATRNDAFCGWAARGAHLDRIRELSTATPKTTTESYREILDRPLVPLDVFQGRLAAIRACPHRAKLAPGEGSACGCSHRCAAGRARHESGTVSLHDCLTCDLILGGGASLVTT